MIVQVQAILYASLAASLFSAFLAMLGKQWLNRYGYTDMRGSAIERSQNRQRKLDGIVAWYFNTVMELLPLMLQFALLLLGCALSRYLWEIDTTVALVVIGVASFGVASYAFFVVAGAISVSCPYQTPGAHALRRIASLALRALHSASSHSRIIYCVSSWWNELKDPELSIGYIVISLAVTLAFLIFLPIFLVIDIYFLGQATVKVFVANALSWFRWARGWDPQTTTLDLHCISWMLWTSLDKPIHLSTLRLLATMTTLANFDHVLVSACFDILTGCMSIIEDKVVVPQESEELAALSALCYLRMLPHLMTVDPASSIFKDTRRRYTKTFPMETNFRDLPSYHRFCIIHNTFYPSNRHEEFYQYPTRRKIQWRDYKLSGPDHVVLVDLAQLEYRGNNARRCPVGSSAIVIIYSPWIPYLPFRLSPTVYLSLRWTWAALFQTPHPSTRGTIISDRYPPADQTPVHGWMRFRT